MIKVIKILPSAHQKCESGIPVRSCGTQFSSYSGKIPLVFSMYSSTQRIGDEVNIGLISWNTAGLFLNSSTRNCRPERQRWATWRRSGFRDPWSFENENFSSGKEFLTNSVATAFSTSEKSGFDSLKRKGQRLCQSYRQMVKFGASWLTFATHSVVSSPLEKNSHTRDKLRY